MRICQRCGCWRYAWCYRGQLVNSLCRHVRAVTRMPTSAQLFVPLLSPPPSFVPLSFPTALNSYGIDAMQTPLPPRSASRAPTRLPPLDGGFTAGAGADSPASWGVASAGSGTTTGAIAATTTLLTAGGGSALATAGDKSSPTNLPLQLRSLPYVAPARLRRRHSSLEPDGASPRVGAGDSSDSEFADLSAMLSDGAGGTGVPRRSRSQLSGAFRRSSASLAPLAALSLSPGRGGVGAATAGATGGGSATGAVRPVWYFTKLLLLRLPASMKAFEGRPVFLGALTQRPETLYGQVVTLLGHELGRSLARVAAVGTPHRRPTDLVFE